MRAPYLLALGLLAVPLNARGADNSGGDPTDINLGCALNSLRGSYMVQGNGSFAPGQPLPFTKGPSIPVNFQNLTVFDGHGNVFTPSGVDVIGGLIEHNTPTVGTYTVNPDCTGELVLHTDHAPQFGGPHTHHVFITIVDEKFYFTFMDPGATGSGIAERIVRRH